MARKPLTPIESRQIADTLQRLVLMELVESGDWSCKNLAFQGGTSLHLVWNSPRYSEDLDFLVAADSEDHLLPSMKRVRQKVQSWLQDAWPECKIELKDKRKPDNSVKRFDIVWSEPQTLGTVLVCVEFYSINKDLVQAYQSNLEQIQYNTSVRLIPAAQREWIYHDKVHAIADRPYLKWRDLFDIWWLRTQSNGVSGRGLKAPWERDDFWSKSNVVNAMYGGDPKGLIPGIEKFLKRPNQEIIDSATKDLAPFLPPKMWSRLSDEGMIAKIVDFVKSDLTQVRDVILRGEKDFVLPEVEEFQL